jgi:crotonobetainyl-CoA:carnitine CoA-transferase CaiB-like acyl-CoA transferase
MVVPHDLVDDPRFADNAARVANREATDALVAAWTRTLGKMEAFAIAKRHRIPLAPVRDVWLLAAHRIGCGDSTNAANVAPVLAGARPHLMVTDPPYGVAYDPSWRAPAWGRLQ